MPGAYPESVDLASAPGRSVLFADLLEVAEMHNARLVVISATKHPANPVLPAGLIARWDSMQASPWQGTVLWDAEEGVFKCWYMGIDAEEAGTQQPRTGYATSEDGIAWERPDLGICEYKGSRANNLLVDNTPRRTNGPCLKDVADPNPARRYKLFLPDENENKEIWNSPDGIHFTREGKPCLTSARTPDGAYRWLPDPEAWFDIHQVLYDPQDPDPQRRYKCYGQISAPKSPDRGGWTSRKGGMAYGPDPWTWIRSTHNPIIDPDDGEEFQIHFISVFPWKGYYFMLYEFGWIEPLLDSYVGDVRLAVSRDGETFRRVNAHEPVIRRGGKHEWDSGFIVTSSDVVVYGSELRLYYSGQAETWTMWPLGDRVPQKVGWPQSVGSIYPAQMGLATLPLDGFTGLESRDHEMPAIVTTIPIEPSDTVVELSASVSRTLAGRSWIDVAVLGSNGEEIEGFGRANCHHLSTDGTDRPVRWADSVHLPSVAEPMQLRFWIYGQAQLHGFAFTESSQ